MINAILTCRHATDNPVTSFWAAVGFSATAIVPANFFRTQCSCPREDNPHPDQRQRHHRHSHSRCHCHPVRPRCWCWCHAVRGLEAMLWRYWRACGASMACHLKMASLLLLELLVLHPDGPLHGWARSHRLRHLDCRSRAHCHSTLALLEF